jgi:hypothetical protein
MDQQMKNFTVAVLFLLFACNNKSEKIKIEEFIWIQHNQNWIWNPEDLEARNYIEYFDSCNQIKFSKTIIGHKHTDYYKSVAPDSLRGLIIENLHGKSFPICLNKLGNGIVYDGDNYCIIYKFSNDSEHIINYIPGAIPDSLRCFTDYVENLTKISSYSIFDSFDRTCILNKFSDRIIPCFPLAPPPAPPDENHVIYRTPDILHTIEKLR